MYYWRKPLVKFGKHDCPYLPRGFLVSLCLLDLLLPIGKPWDIIVVAEKCKSNYCALHCSHCSKDCQNFNWKWIMTIIKTFKIIINRFSIYRYLRVIFRVGLVRYLKCKWQLRSILNARPVRTLPTGSNLVCCEFHIMTSQSDWLMALWAAWSFYHFSQVEWPLVIHDGGGLSQKYFYKWFGYFPTCVLLVGKRQI